MSALERIFYIDQRIREQGSVRLKEVEDRFEISNRQVKRDIEYLRDRLDAPIEWESAGRRYVYHSPWQGLEFADEKALLFYVFARAAAGTLAYVPLAEAGPLEQLLELVPEALRPLAQDLRYELPEFEPASVEGLGVFMRAINEGRQVNACYRDAEGKASDRTIEPLRLINYAGTWYCVAFDPKRNGLRTFKISRFERAALRREKASGTVPREDIDRFLDSSYGMFKGEGDKRAIIRFYGKALEIVRSEIWHPAQMKARGRDERRGEYIELTIPASRYDELIGRVLRFGADAEAVAPEEFRDAWKAEIRRMYDGMSK
jgi:predicted DNA-binding transcriptional regulator YafY